MPLYKNLYKKISYLEAGQAEQIHQAYLFAKEAHLNQKRDSGESYIVHPIAAAEILADMHMDHQCIIAALLHDTVEDTAVNKEIITNQFGKAVAELVDGVTKLTQIESASKAETQAQSFRKMVLAMSRDIRVIIIKLADRWHNMQTIAGVTKSKRHRISRETLDIYAPIANRLGMHTIYIELENLAFSALYPRRFRVLKEALEKSRGSRKEIIKTIEKELKQHLAKNNLEQAIVIGREKHLHGIYKKMMSRHVSFSEIMDVYAFRIVVNNIDDCYRTLGIVHGLYKPVPGKFKDYIAIPKSNGYQSLHTILFGPYGLPIEIQIRTEAMDQMANNGIAAHWIYKSGERFADAAHVRAQQWVNNLLEMQRNTSSSLEFIENVKVDLFPDEIYVFTPKGSIIELPRGATAVDFAYAIHTDIGNTCIAVRINQQYVSLSTSLANGQTISIITAPNAKPNPAWLSFAITARARSGIRGYLKSQKRDDSISLGKTLLEKAFADLNLDTKNITEAAIMQVLKKDQIKDIANLYEDIGLGNRFAGLVAHQLMNATKNESLQTTDDTQSKPLLIHGAEGVAINFAPCCGPIPGEHIVGYFNAGHGLDIHVEDCINLAKMRKQPEKCLPVSWDDDAIGDFKVSINVEMLNKHGGLADLTKAISESNANIDGINMSERNSGFCLVSLTLLVKNSLHLERVIRHISKVSTVVGVIRKKGS